MSLYNPTYRAYQEELCAEPIETVSFTDRDISLKLNFSSLLVQLWTLIQMRLIWEHSATINFIAWNNTRRSFFYKMMEYSFKQGEYASWCDIKWVSKLIWSYEQQVVTSVPRNYVIFHWTAVRISQNRWKKQLSIKIIILYNIGRQLRSCNNHCNLQICC